jgi:ribosomal protein S18 acetylase RimI-like enzyme
MPPAELKIELRPATSADIEPLYPIHREGLRESVEATWGPWDETYQSARFRKHFDLDLRQVIVVDDADVGFLDVEQRPEDVWLAEIVISAAHQRRGIGSRLIGDLLASAAARQVPVRLQVLKVNPARQLYERLGFVETGQSETHYQMEATPRLISR